MSCEVNDHLSSAKLNKIDEFYTFYEDIASEMFYFAEELKNKIIYCNCDDYKISNFYKYFSDNFSTLGIKKLITSCYKKDSTGYGIIKTKDKEVNFSLQGNGDFRNNENIEILKKCDIIVTNPPFSIVKKYVEQLIEYNKKFIILYPILNYSYKPIAKQITNKSITAYQPNKNTLTFYTDKNEHASFSNIVWLTNVQSKKEKQKIIPNKEYNPETYIKYYNYDAIHIDRITNIPKDYFGVMGVPLTTITKDLSDYDILGVSNGSGIGLEDDRDYSNFTAIGSDGKLKTHKRYEKNQFLKGQPLLVGKPKDKQYYINEDGFCLYGIFKRLFIQRRKK